MPVAVDGRRKILVVGIYLADQENNVAAIVGEMGCSTAWDVEQRWVALGNAPAPAHVTAVTSFRSEGPAPKFALLNRLLAQLDPAPYEFVLVTDDDISLGHDFLDRYLDLVERHDLALAQPARTHDSGIDHPFVEQRDDLEARRTRFVEIGPLFSMRRDALPLLAPFDEGSPMGWGYDFAWPVIIERAGLRMGIVDATPVTHALRDSVAHYDHDQAWKAMDDYLARHAHLSREEAFSVVQAFPSAGHERSGWWTALTGWGRRRR